MIDKEITRRIIDEQISQLSRGGLVAKHGWSIEVKDTTVYVKMRSGKDGEEYLLRIECDGYPEKEPLTQFVDFSSRVPKPDVWPVDKPVGDKPFFLPSRMIVCVVPSCGSVLSVPEIIQKVQFYLDYEGYLGRVSSLVRRSKFWYLGVDEWLKSQR
jgi:hypothetical protein